MKIIFAGTPDFSVPTLSALIASEHEVVAVLTQPDKPKGRGRKVAMSPVKILAASHNLPVLQPATLKNEDIQSRLQAYNADLMVVIAYGLLLPKPVLEMFPRGCINVHASLLPKYRGASPIQSSILNGDSETGVTIMQMDIGMDTGDMLHHAKCELTPSDNAKSLHDKLSQIGADALMHVIPCIDKGTLTPTKQDDKLATYAKKITKDEADIDWTQPALIIERQIRGYYGWPVAFSSLEGERMRIWEASVSDKSSEGTPGQILESARDGVTICCGEGALTLTKIQLPGGKVLPVQDCLNANARRFEAGKVLGK